jgi:hypothetical protein
METLTALNSMSGITAATNMRMAENEKFSSAPVKKSFSEPSTQMPCSLGDGSLMTAANAESTAPFSETKAHTLVANSYAKRIRLLIASGLIAGITPTSVRKRSNQATLDFAFSKQDGINAE